MKTVMYAIAAVLLGLSLGAVFLVAVCKIMGA